MTSNDLSTLRSIARAGSDYNTIKKLIAETRWTIEEDSVELGHLRVLVPEDNEGQHYV